MKNRLIVGIIGFVILLVIPNIANAQLNAGIVKGVWYSHYPVFVGKEVSIFVGVQNYSGQNLNGLAEFYDNDQFIGSSGFEVQKNGLVSATVKHIFKKGSHNIKVNLINTKTGDNFSSNGTLRDVFISTLDTIVVDEDFDEDNIPDGEDKDDDDDGLSDRRENTLGTDPKNPDSDGDGLKDGEDKKPLISGGEDQKKKPDSETVSLIKETKDSLDSIALPFTARLIEQLENRKKNLFDVSVELQAKGETNEGPGSRFKVFVIDFVILILKNWLIVLFIILAVWFGRKFWLRFRH